MGVSDTTEKDWEEHYKEEKLNEFFNFDAVIELEKKISYNQALEDLLDRIDLMFLYKDTKGVFHSASYANLNRKSIHSVVEQLKK